MDKAALKTGVLQLRNLLNLQKCLFSNVSNEVKPKTPSQHTQLKKPREGSKNLKHKKAHGVNDKKSNTEIYGVETKPGDKKDVTVQFPKSYSPQFTEAAWYSWWEKQGFFNPDYNSRKGSDNPDRFVTVLPPPNVTGSLHLGHALGTSIQDALVRWHRMCGREVLWNPGCDHAGIATQVVVEKKLWREQQKTRHDLGREEFIKEVWKWKEEKGVEIYEQMKRLGLSLDWSRAAFTLDPKLSDAVNEAFIRLHDEGLIYRSKRMVNWSCALKSAISDIEVENIAVEGKTYFSVPGYSKKIPFGVMTHFAYPVKDSGEEIVVATTRPETMLGDTAVAVHPDDPRYTHLHGKEVIHPFCEDRAMPIVCDEFVQQNKGTGAVKITPCHDPEDYAVGLRHKLDFIDILDDSGNMINVDRVYQGLPRFDARKKILDALKSIGLLREEKNHSMTVPICSRSSDVIEPRLKDQWFVNCSDMTQKAIQVVKNGELEIIPKQYESQWYAWLNNTGDWCVSRQLWWGHRIPAYQVTSHSHNTLQHSSIWVSAHSEQEAVAKAAQQLGTDALDIEVRQDDDVLDTWFSSAVFPFSIFGWPSQTEDLCKFYPTNLLETGSDIMFFWVARMVMMGQKLTGTLPFKQVLFHSILRDAHGRKMSKSLGNVIDPMHVIHGRSLEELQMGLENSNLDKKEISKARAGQKKDFPQGIPECGADALRFALASYNYKAYFSNVDVNHIKTNRNFCNKIHQAFRFLEGALGETFNPPNHETLLNKQTYKHGSKTDMWILSRLSNVVHRCDQSFRNYNLNEATQALYQFWRADFCDVYLEYSKRALTENNTTTQLVLYLCMHTALRLLSPFMPYITEELFQRLPRDDDIVSVCVAPYPQPDQYNWYDSVAENEMAIAQNLISQVLSLRKDFNLTKAKPPVFIRTDDDETIRAVQNHLAAFETLSRSYKVTLLSCQHPHPEGCCVIDVAPVEIFMQIKDHIDIGSTKKSLQKQKCACEDTVKNCQEYLVDNTIEEEGELSIMKKEELKKTEAKLARINNALNAVNKLMS